MGVPVIGCDCSVCTSDDPRNQRTRTSALVQALGTTLLIDAGPDLRMQVLRERVTSLDAVLLTHGHLDHVGGIDDLRPFTMHTKISASRSGPLPMYGDATTIERVRHQFDYAFDPAPSMSTRPLLETHVHDGPFTVGTLRVTPFAVLHGTMPITGYRIGALGYLTDAKRLPQATIDLLRGVDVLVLNALRYTKHPLHLSLDEAQELVAEIKPRRAFFVHMTHDLDHELTNAQLPRSMQLAFDGEVVDLPDPTPE
ncbi:MAG: MBL fold metallo-hydrolase [Herpetosiphon sp.]